MNRALLPGDAEGTALVLGESLSMWGGLDPSTGEVIDRRHPQSGSIVTDTVLVLPWGRGSSSAASVLAEAIRLGTAPAAIVLSEPDDIILLGALVAEELYDITCPVIVADDSLYSEITTGDHIAISFDAAVLREPAPHPPLR
jgi:predicted aconitase with swiveling domain